MEDPQHACNCSSAVHAGSGGDHRTRLRQELLTRMFDDNVMELLMVIAQHAHMVITAVTAPA